MKIARKLTSLESEMLHGVVDLYIDTGCPVSSRTLKARCRLDISTANIRKILFNLEMLGYLSKPHVSAGRVPTDKGYRRYVDSLGTPDPLNRRMIEAIRKRVGREWDDVREIMMKTSRLLGDLTSYMGLFMGVYQACSILERLRIVQTEGNRGLVVLSLRPWKERHVYIDFPKRYLPYVMDRAVQIINERVAGLPVDVASKSLAEYLKTGSGAEKEIAQAVAAEAEYLFNRDYNFDYYFSGGDKHVADAGFNSLSVLRNLVRIMGEKSLILQVLKNRFDHDLTVTIGGENEIEEMEAFSVVTRRFSTDKYDGLVGILGPTRMSYGLVVSLLNRMAEELQC